ncbi:MAG: hypothetical protein Q9N26_01875 [Aquificota bacterium]|nr:hypothetical protein [Aquificota bacterium]MDQ7083216.1 hypothetical protein [Aquificota bacterium]
MRVLKLIFVKDWKYKLIALTVSIALWGVVNFGTRTTITVSRYVEVRNGSHGLQYSVRPDRVEITVYVVERLILSRFIAEVKAYVDVSKLKGPGSYRVKVRTETLLPWFIHPASVEPPAVLVEVNRR